MKQFIKKETSESVCELKRHEKKSSGLTISVGLTIDVYSQASSHYRRARSLLLAAFPPWAGTALTIQPGRFCFRRDAHVDAGLSAVARST